MLIFDLKLVGKSITVYIVTIGEILILSSLILAVLLLKKKYSYIF